MPFGAHLSRSRNPLRARSRYAMVSRGEAAWALKRQNQRTDLELVAGNHADAQLGFPFGSELGTN